MWKLFFACDRYGIYFCIGLARLNWKIFSTGIRLLEKQLDNVHLYRFISFYLNITKTNAQFWINSITDCLSKMIFHFEIDILGNKTQLYKVRSIHGKQKRKYNFKRPIYQGWNILRKWLRSAALHNRSQLKVHKLKRTGNIVPIYVCTYS